MITLVSFLVAVTLMSFLVAAGDYFDVFPETRTFEQGSQT